MKYIFEYFSTKICSQGIGVFCRYQSIKSLQIPASMALKQNNIVIGSIRSLGVSILKALTSGFAIECSNTISGTVSAPRKGKIEARVNSSNADITTIAQKRPKN